MQEFPTVNPDDYAVVLFELPSGYTFPCTLGSLVADGRPIKVSVTSQAGVTMSEVFLFETPAAYKDSIEFIYDCIVKLGCPCVYTIHAGSIFKQLAWCYTHGAYESKKPTPRFNLIDICEMFNRPATLTFVERAAFNVKTAASILGLRSELHKRSDYALWIVDQFLKTNQANA